MYIIILFFWYLSHLYCTVILLSVVSISNYMKSKKRRKNVQYAGQFDYVSIYKRKKNDAILYKLKEKSMFP